MDALDPGHGNAMDESTLAPVYDCEMKWSLDLDGEFQLPLYSQKLMTTDAFNGYEQPTGLISSAEQQTTATDHGQHKEVEMQAWSPKDPHILDPHDGKPRLVMKPGITDPGTFDCNDLAGAKLNTFGGAILPSTMEIQGTNVGYTHTQAPHYRKERRCHMVVSEEQAAAKKKAIEEEMKSQGLNPGSKTNEDCGLSALTAARLQDLDDNKDTIEKVKNFLEENETPNNRLMEASEFGLDMVKATLKAQYLVLQARLNTISLRPRPSTTDILASASAYSSDSTPGFLSGHPSHHDSSQVSVPGAHHGSKGPNPHLAVVPPTLPIQHSKPTDGQGPPTFHQPFWDAHSRDSELNLHVNLDQGLGHAVPIGSSLYPRSLTPGAAGIAHMPLLRRRAMPIVRLKYRSNSRTRKKYLRRAVRNSTRAAAQNQ